MYEYIWPIGNSSETLRGKLEDFINYWIKNAKYKNRLPRRHISVIQQGAKQNAGICIIIITEKDANPGWDFTVPTGVNEGKGAVTESHNIGLIVKGDKASGGAETVITVHNVLQSLFFSRPGSTEYNSLITSGIGNLFESAEGLMVMPGEVSDEGNSYSRAITLTCSTDILIS